MRLLQKAVRLRYNTVMAEAERVLVRDLGEWSALYDGYEYDVPLDDARLTLPDDLAEALRSPDLRAAQRLARYLGPGWEVRYGEGVLLCWGCERVHGEEGARHPQDLVVKGEFKCPPLRAEGFGEFFPDDPVAAVEVPRELSDVFRAWARGIDVALDQWTRDRLDFAYEVECERLFKEGRGLAERLAKYVGAGRRVTYLGLANGGLSSMSWDSWVGEHRS
ncbi:hypothetical protein ACVNF4_06920 [Streptomyces sp. S6]